MKAIVDCNNFYCSCERLFKPHLNTKPLVVLSNNDGCIISRSDEAKALGIKMAQAYFLSKPLLRQQGIVAFSSNYNLYGDMSKRVMETMQTMFAPENVEVYSVDEAFVDMTHVPMKDLFRMVEILKERIGKWTGIPVSIGVAPTKTLAKIANRLAKADKAKSNCMLLLDNEAKVHTALRQTPIDEIWGVGKQYSEKLEKLGVKTAFDLLQMPEEWARKNLGGVVGIRLIKELKGVNAISLNEQLTVKKIVSCTRRFGLPLRDLKPMKEAIATYVARAAEKLRRQQSAARHITVFLIEKTIEKGDIYKPNEAIKREMTLPTAMSATNELIKFAIQLLQKLFVQGLVYEKAGVVFSKLVPDSAVQANFFTPLASGMNQALMEKVDNINFSMRNEPVRFGSTGLERSWKMRQELLSKRYTTRWAELREIN